MNNIKQKFISILVFIWSRKLLLLLLLVPIFILFLFLYLWFYEVVPQRQIIFIPASFSIFGVIYTIPFLAILFLFINYFLAYLCRNLNRLVIYFLFGYTIVIEILFLFLARAYLI